MKILISILSDYLQPNFLLIKELENQYDSLIFITTEDMEKETKKKSLWLEKALCIKENSVHRIPVVEDDFDGIKSCLANENFSSEDDYILNLTGGTKIIPLAVYEFFKDGFHSKFYYVPIGKNVIKDLLSDNEIPLNYRMNLQEYLTLNSLRYECDNSLIYDEDFTNDLFERFRKVKFNRYKVKEIRESQNLPDSTDKRYYGGIWFEEYCYTRLKREENLPDDAICKSAKIFRDKSEQNDNEIDIMFVKDNKLYVFECKVGMTGYGSTPKETIEQYMYKLAAIAKDFGLRVESYILTLHKIYNNPNNFSPEALENIEKRISILGIKKLLDSVVFTRHEPLLKICSKDAVKQPNSLIVHQQNSKPLDTSVDIPPMYKEEPPKIELKIIGKIEL